MTSNDLDTTIQAIFARGKGILAADESFPTIEKRFKELGIASNEESRRSYREMLFTTPGIGDYVSGTILFDETIRQNTRSGELMPRVIESKGVVPGIKVDAGTEALPGFDREKFTGGLDGLRVRLAEYRRLGARFTKWRAVISIGEGLPSRTCIETNARIHALFAGLSQEAGLVPIVEPEILMDGDHSIGRCEEVATHVLGRVFDTLTEHRVVLEQMILKTGMVLSGEGSATQAGDEEVAAATLRCFRRSVPPAVPGIVFLSGGQKDVDATRRLNEICRHGDLPWKVTFSYGRALQDAAMKAWAGDDKNVGVAQRAFVHRARCNSLAVQGSYSDSTERAAA